ncbi:MAG: UbiH/UbiF/VisC/COQ6 family ubiquinone biosynthesis hydroxylase [Granulosicoccus sp.]|nr:UbiH/UbiF/VisC/COQ6 family ubiquinone biosynthesis hydroxylase [Granulosicoccus sp.]
MAKNDQTVDVEYDVVIVGGGMVGNMLAAALLSTTELRVAVLEQQPSNAFVPGSNPDYDLRVSAVSIATQRMLENVGAWQKVISRRACPYREMLVWDGEKGGQTLFNSDEVGASALGHIVENRVLQLALLDQINISAMVDHFCPVRLLSMHTLTDRVVCVVDASEQGGSASMKLSAKLLVAADGANSKVRELAGISYQRDAYPQHALVATVETALPQQQITWQRFMPTGPQAFLPLCGSRASLVWYHDEEEISRLAALNNNELQHAIQSAFPERLGDIRRLLDHGSFPISKAQANRYIDRRVVLIGDAAHSVHPLAGQGLNLGMMDAAALAQILGDAMLRHKDIGSDPVLRRYERWRKGENAVMIAILDGFYHAFKPQPVPIQKIRSGALAMANRTGFLKRYVMRYAMGTGPHLPPLAR